MKNDLLNFDISVSRETFLKISHCILKDICITFPVKRVTLANDLPELFTAIMVKWVEAFSQGSRQPLPRRQKEFYDKLVNFYHENGHPPTVQDMQHMGQFKSTGTPAYYCNQLIKAGWAWRDGNKIVPIDIQPKGNLLTRSEEGKDG